MSAGPIIPLLFLRIKFTIVNGWQITGNNFICLLLSVVNFVLLTVAYLFLSNLTIEPAFKLVAPEISPPSSVRPVRCTEPDDKVKLWTLKDILSRLDILFILIAQAVLVGAYCQLEQVVVMTAIEDFDFNLTQIALSTSIGVITSTIIIIFIEKKLLNSPNNIYFVFVESFASAIVVMTLINVTVAARNFASFPVLILVITLSIALNTLLYYGCSFCSRWIMFAIAPSHSASIVESHRFNYGTVLAVFAFFTSPYVFAVKFYATIGYVVVFSLIIVSLLVKRKFYLEKNE